ncbi:MAG: type II toxin-antitoxin system VapB family antitoxin [Rhizobiaceae bacterium]|nr:type II toxin-antitoxin system VapB family antitoxin [Rhizobiaceae bacterium]MCV0406947.1 type II toxin-antitoxin system VapB family antitoxin [Rhizobiaceae bacterium]
MAITIRNKATEELIRRIGRRTGEGPSAVIRRLAAAEAAKASEPEVSEEVIKRRIERFEEIARRYPPPDPKPGWDEVQADMDAMYDYLDEPTASPGRRTG